MRIHVNLSALRQIKPREHALRFVIGGAAAVATGLIAKQCGPGAGGLFLAFPVIFPAGATLIEKHIRESKAKAGVDGTCRARDAVSLDARGAAIGSLALIIFALTAWVFLRAHDVAAALLIAMTAWLLASLAIWWAFGYARHRCGRKK